MGPAAIASRWRHSLPPLKAVSNPNVAISFSRWLSKPSATQALDLENLQKPSVPTEPMFGLTKRLPRSNAETEDLISASSEVASQKETSDTGKSSSKAEGDNYFSTAWASQRNLSKRPWPRLAEQTIRGREFLQSDAAYQQLYQCNKRVWQYASDVPEFAQEKFIIASYNILASTFARLHKSLLYGHVPVALLEWKRRKLKIIFELGLCTPDIICLQEVDRFKDLEEELAFKGYAGMYKARTGDAPDGCAIFWRRTRFRLVQQESLEFSAVGMRDNVAQFCVLESLASGPVSEGSKTAPRLENSGKSQCLIVGNIHLLYNPKRGDIKLGQCRVFLEKAYVLSSLWPDAPLVIGGDFNSTPSSAIYDFLATSELEISGSDRNYLSGQITEVANSASKHSRATRAMESGKETSASGQLKTFLMEAESIEISKSVRGSEVPHVQSLRSRDARPYSIQEGDTDSSIVYGDCTEDKANPTEEIHVSVEINKNDGVSGSEIKWDLDELKTATGDPQCTVVQHKLNLCSVYSEVQGQDGTRDKKGEPLITTYNTMFMGTVDYIWRSDGLQPVRVLETIPLEGMMVHKGLPTQLWGSDHLAIACELAFTLKQTGLGSNKVEPGI